MRPTGFSLGLRARPRLLGPEGADLARQDALPALPVETPLLYVLWVLALSSATGLVAGVAPARRAARLDPLLARHAE